MTNFFGINITDNQANANIDGEMFAANSINAEQNIELEQALATEEDLKKKSNLPLSIEIIKVICFIVWITVLTGLISARSFVEGYRNASVLCWIGLMCFIVWLPLFCIKKVRGKRIEKAAVEQHIEKVDTLWHNVKQSFGIPQDADCIDVFAEYYIIKNGKPKHKVGGMVDFINFQMYAFARGGNLCLANMERLWEIPLSSFRSISLSKKITSLPYWNKSEPINSVKYKPYKIKRNQLGQYFAKYYRVEIVDLKGEFYLLIPEYDGEIFMRLTNLNIKQSRETVRKSY